MKFVAATDVTQTGVIKDAIYAPQWDFQRLTVGEASAPCLERSFFQFPVGQYCPAAIERIIRCARTQEETSFYQYGMFPKGVEFYATGLRVLVVPGWDERGAWDPKDDRDYERVTRAGLLELLVGDRVYAKVTPLAAAPACFLTPRRFMKPVTAQLPFIALINEMKEYKQTYQSITPIHIESRPVELRITFSHALGLERDAMLGVIMDGYVLRAAQ